MPRRSEPADRTARLDKIAAAREADRAAERVMTRLAVVSLPHNAQSDGDELALLNEQLDDIAAESDDEASEECDIIKARFIAIRDKQNKQAALEANKQAALETNKELTFTCAICLDDCKLMACTGLRLVTPCGHGFCAACIEDHMCGPAPSSDCPTCRKPIASVVTPYF
jgi:hypothetical protein